MDFSWTDEQRDFRDSTINFAKHELNSNLLHRDKAAEFDQTIWKKCADFGIQGLPMPDEYGGSQQDVLSTVLAMEALGCGSADNGLLFALGAQMWSVQIPLLLFGSEFLKKRYLPRLINGELIGAHAATEPNAGSDIFSLRTTATRRNGCYLLNGQKTFVTNAPIAGVFLVLAKVSSLPDGSELTAFMVERNSPGLSAATHLEKMGLRTSMLGEVYFDDCPVCSDHVLGNEGEGSAVFRSAVEWERAFILAPAIGSMQRILGQTINYARARRQFGKPIGKNQAVAHKIADMQLRLEAARMLLYRTAWLKREGRRLSIEPSEVKLHVSEAWVQTCMDALQIHGGNGYMVETGIEREVRDALASKIYSGTSEMQRSIIAGCLGL